MLLPKHSCKAVCQRRSQKSGKSVGDGGHCISLRNILPRLRSHAAFVIFCWLEVVIAARDTACKDILIKLSLYRRSPWKLITKPSMRNLSPSRKSFSRAKSVITSIWVTWMECKNQEYQHSVMYQEVRSQFNVWNVKLKPTSDKISSTEARIKAPVCVEYIFQL